LRIVFHPRAVEDAIRIEAWWRANRPAALDLFQRELETTVVATASSPTLGAISPADDELPDVRRVLMRRTRYYVYYPGHGRRAGGARDLAYGARRRAGAAVGRAPGAIDDCHGAAHVEGRWGP
jgi:hypothetical protein